MTTTMHPAAYLRRSYVDANSPGDISRDAQLGAVRKLAAADGHNGSLVEYDDWGISADVAKAGKRTAFTRLLTDLEAGRVTALYAFDVDRLYRDPRDLIRLQDAAQRHQVRIVTTAGPLAIGDGDDPAAEAFAFIGSVFGRMELQKAKKRARAALEARRARGDVFGHPRLGYRHLRGDNGAIVAVPDESARLEPIRQAYLDAGTVLGATKLLNERKIPTATGRGRWSLSMVQRTIAHHWPELLPPKGASGKRIRATSVLAQIVRCHCGQVMTPNNVRGQLYCSRAVVIGRPRHGKYNVGQAAILEWAREEAARLAIPYTHAELTVETSERRAVLERQREDLGWAVVRGVLPRDKAEPELARIEAELGKLDEREAIVEIPALDWSAPPEKVNAVLHALWDYIELDGDMRPVRAEWRVPEWRAGG